MDQAQPTQPTPSTVAPQLPALPPKTDNTSSIVTIILLLIAYPIGLIVMWVWPKWNKIIKVLVTVPLVLSILVGVMLVRSVLSNPELRGGFGALGAMSECMKITDKKEQEKCVATKISTAIVDAACKSDKVKPEECKQAQEGIKQFTTCMQTKSVDECQKMMESSMQQSAEVDLESPTQDMPSDVN